MSFSNAYQDAIRAENYATLAFRNTYHLAFRDLPDLFWCHAPGPRALDFGCGTGRSTRFLRGLGFEPEGSDISPEMVEEARRRDPSGPYVLVPEGEVHPGHPATFDLALSAFTFDNIPTWDLKRRILAGLHRALRPGGLFVNLVSSPDLYSHEWASFSTRDFPGNRGACPGDIVHCVTTDYPDARPVQDVYMTEESYRDLHAEAGFQVLDVRHPLARGDEPYPWVHETQIAPWHLHVLRKA